MEKQQEGSEFIPPDHKDGIPPTSLFNVDRSLPKASDLDKGLPSSKDAMAWAESQPTISYDPSQEG